VLARSATGGAVELVTVRNAHHARTADYVSGGKRFRAHFHNQVAIGIRATVPRNFTCSPGIRILVTPYTNHGVTHEYCSSR